MKKVKEQLQGSYGSWKTWKVMEFENFIFQAWKGMEFCGRSWKVMENYNYKSLQLSKQG